MLVFFLFAVLVLVSVPVVMLFLFLMMVMLMLMGMPFRVFVVLVPVVMLMLMVVMPVVVVAVLVLVVGVGRAFVNTEFHAFHLLPLLAVEVHVEIAEVELGEFPLEGGWFHAEIDEGADGHVTGDAGKAIEEEDFHGKRCGAWLVMG